MVTPIAYVAVAFFYIFFLAFDFMSFLRGHSVFSSPPQRPMTSDFEGSSSNKVVYVTTNILLFQLSWIEELDKVINRPDVLCQIARNSEHQKGRPHNRLYLNPSLVKWLVDIDCYSYQPNIFVTVLGTLY